jgi:hypothetical protein
MSHTLFSAVSEINGQLAALGQVDQTLAVKVDALTVKVDELNAKLDTLTQAMQTSVLGLTQTLLNVQSVIGAPGDNG